MSYFILEQIFLVSIGVMIYMIVRTLPRVNGFDLAQEKEKKKGPTLQFKQEWVDVLDKHFIASLEKTLRRMKVWVMKLDNYVSRNLERVSPKRNGEKENQPNIFEDKGQSFEEHSNNSKEE